MSRTSSYQQVFFPATCPETYGYGSGLFFHRFQESRITPYRRDGLALQDHRGKEMKGTAIRCFELLTDAEAGKDPSQQIVTTKGTSDLAKSLLGHAQIFSQQFPGTQQG